MPWFGFFRSLLSCYMRFIFLWWTFTTTLRQRSSVVFTSCHFTRRWGCSRGKDCHLKINIFHIWHKHSCRLLCTALLCDPTSGYSSMPWSNGSGSSSTSGVAPAASSAMGSVSGSPVSALSTGGLTTAPLSWSSWIAPIRHWPKFGHCGSLE